MRVIAIALLLLIPITADAQRRSHSSRGSTRSARAEALARSPEEVRLPAGSRTPARQLPGLRTRDRHFPFDRGPRHRRPWRSDNRFDNRFSDRMPFGFGALGGYYAPNAGYGYGFYAPDTDVADEDAAREGDVSTTSTTGLLRLEVTPASGLDYYVDGVFIGTSSNLGSQFELNAGARRVEVRAAGYNPLVFDVRLIEGRETTFRGSLEPLTRTASPPPQATGNRTMFIIPGCYMGNSRPSQNELRDGCDIKRLITR
jgi:hypothetical protein